jgi:hypothetical protein
MAVHREARSAWDEMAEDDVLLEAAQVVATPHRGRVRENTRRVLEGRCRYEALCLERRFRDAEQRGGSFRRPLALGHGLLVRLYETLTRNLLAPKELGVAWVRYPSRNEKTLADKYLPNGAGGMVVFGVHGGAENARKLADSVPLFSLLANVGDAKSLIIHPASTTHSQLSPEDQLKARVLPELVRLSIGLEHIDDILADLDQALNAADRPSAMR